MCFSAGASFTAGDIGAPIQARPDGDSRRLESGVGGGGRWLEAGAGGQTIPKLS
jgi:hypothetical protein